MTVFHFLTFDYFRLDFALTYRAGSRPRRYHSSPLLPRRHSITSRSQPVRHSICHALPCQIIAIAFDFGISPHYIRCRISLMLPAYRSSAAHAAVLLNMRFKDAE
jgi:hypothetical protein